MAFFLLAAALAAIPSFTDAAAPAPAPAVAAFPASGYKFCFGGAALPGFTPVDAAARFSDAPGESAPGFENGGGAYPVAAGDHLTAAAPFYFSIKVPEGNYRVTVHLGGSEEASTTVKSELRRLMLEPVHTGKGQTARRTFSVSVRQPPILDATGKRTGTVRTKGREAARGGALNRNPGGEGWSWDDVLTLEFSGKPALQGIEIVRDDSLHTLFLCGDSTVCDQPAEPFNSWGQMITRWFAPDTVVSNLAISGETMPAFLGENRLAKITSQMRPGDYVFVQFGHNDMKSTSPEALNTYRQNLVRFITETKAAGGVPVLFTPVSRETFDDAGKITNSFVTARKDDFAKAVKEVAAEQKVQLIDLQAASATLYEALGKEHSQVLFANAQEKTHHSDYGSYEISKCVVQAIIDAKLPLASHISPDWKPFDPAHPDPVADFTIPPDPSPGRQQTPAGN
jgi:lysophospholipase L1-like esterase